MKKITITEEQLYRMVEDAASAIVDRQRSQKTRREPKFDEDGVEIPEFEDDMNDPSKYVQFDKEHSNWDSLGKPRGWRELYLKARRNLVNSTAKQMRGDGGDFGTNLDNAWVKALKAEYPNPSERAKAYNDFSKRIDAFRGYEPQIYDNVSDDDENAVWNQKRR